jgi:hypothetical protein
MATRRLWLGSVACALPVPRRPEIGASHERHSGKTAGGRISHFGIDRVDPGLLFPLDVHVLRPSRAIGGGHIILKRGSSLVRKALAGQFR